MKKLVHPLALAFTMLALAAGVRAQSPVSVVGTWDYKLDTGQGEMNGVLTITDSSGVLGGTIAADDGKAFPLEHPTLSGDTLAFGFTSPEYGPGTAQLAFAGETFKGRLSVPAFGRFPVRGTRRAGEVTTGVAAAPATPAAGKAILSTRTLLRDLFQNEQAKAVLEKHVPGLTTNPQIDQAMGMSLRDIAQYAPDTFTEQVLQALDEDLGKL